MPAASQLTGWDGSRSAGLASSYKASLLQERPSGWGGGGFTLGLSPFTGPHCSWVYPS